VFHDLKIGEPHLNILIIRRDNIGDLLCTTPLLRGLKDQLKVSRLDVVTNAYVAPVLKGNPLIDQLYIYHKIKHGQISFLNAILEKLRLIANLRKYHYDYILAFDHRAKNLTRYLKKTKVLTPIQEWTEKTEVERVWEIGQRLGLKGKPGPLELPFHLYRGAFNKKNNQCVGVHISARRLRQQYPAKQWVELIRKLNLLNPKLIFHIFWSPGDTRNPIHPGDDEKAKILKKDLKKLPVKFIKTLTLESLIKGIQTCDVMIMADGGAMHIAAALNRPIIALFGDSNQKRWRPFGVPHIILHEDTNDVRDIRVSSIINAWKRILKIK
jgi:ADP-heptose:LPS heptosyltransferase